VADPAGGAAADRPARTSRTPRAGEIVATARAILDGEGHDALTMRRLGDDMGMRAPSLYKHFPDKAALLVALIEEALAETGEVLHRAVERPGRRTPVEALLHAYRRHCTERPHLYRLATAGPLPRPHLPAGLEEWVGAPFELVTGDEHRARALWSLSHGMVLLEIDGRYPEGADLDRAWQAAAEAFTPHP
jgi:AcrR family transcriptional regulator